MSSLRYGCVDQIISYCWHRPAASIVAITSISGGLLYWLYLRRSTSATHSPWLQDKPCRYRLDKNTSATHTLPDGRKLGYAEYGSPTGKAILYCHGLAGSRIEAAHHHDLAIRLGVRIIAVDRSGHGWSSHDLDRSLTSFAKDLECLAEHFQLKSYAVLGTSGGGPYALACAASMPADKLKAVTVLCGVGPWDTPSEKTSWPRRFAVKLAFHYWPFTTFISWFMSRIPAHRLDLSDEVRFDYLMKQLKAPGRPEKDAAIVLREEHEDLTRLALRSMREAFAQGTKGFMQDGKVLTSPWDFRLEDIRKDLPVRLWYGKQDATCPPSYGEEIATRAGGMVMLRVEDETHTSMQVNFQEEVWTDLVRAMNDVRKQG